MQVKGEDPGRRREGASPRKVVEHMIRSCSAALAADMVDAMCAVLGDSEQKSVSLQLRKDAFAQVLAMLGKHRPLVLVVRAAPVCRSGNCNRADVIHNAVRSFHLSL